MMMLPVVSLGAEHLVMGLLMRRNILAYKAPPCNEGYDLICIHPDPRHVLGKNEASQIRVQVKSRYQTDCDRSVDVKPVSADAFDYLVVAFLNTGHFFKGRDGSSGNEHPEFFTFPASFIKSNIVLYGKGNRPRVHLKGRDKELLPYKNDCGFEMIAKALGIPKPTKKVFR